MAARRPYVRPMEGWWRRNPFFLVYMLREVTAIFVMIYGLTLVAGLLRLSQGRAAFEEWLDGLASPWSIAFHVFLLAIFLYHTLSWFQIMPKTMPPVVVGGRKLSPGTITAAGLVASAGASIVLYILLRWLAS